MKKLLTTAAIILSANIMAESITYKKLECEFNDSTELERAIFTLNGSYEVINNKKAKLTANALIQYPEGSDYGSYRSEGLKDDVVFAVTKDLRNTKYKGRKYNNHFKFNLPWESVGGEIEYADLIISKTPVTTEDGRYGSKIYTFDGALDLSYNDHHGDTVWIKCSAKVWPR